MKKKAASKKRPDENWRMREIRARMPDYRLPDRVNWKALLDLGMSPQQALHCAEQEHLEKQEKKNADD